MPQAGSGGWQGQLKRLDEYRWLIPKAQKPGMRVDGIIYATERMLQTIKADQSLEQVANVATLPGIVKYSLAMPDIHWGYGFPIGGVAAMRLSDGVISPGGVGYDINCGVRLFKSSMRAEEMAPKVKEFIDKVFYDIPSGVGSKSRLRLSYSQLADVLVKGAQWAVEAGYGTKEDIELTESNGRLPGADPSKVSRRALERGAPQLGTIGSGNHFLEVQVVDRIYDAELAKHFGLSLGQVVFLIHTGSRGFGHQVCDDYLIRMQQAVSKYKIQLPDRQLACAPIDSPEGKDYLAAMACAANYAWCNRQIILHWAREALCSIFKRSEEELGLKLIYDVAHNIAKMETHEIDGKQEKVCVHRKGATRAFPANHPEVPEIYKPIGQPVLIPGDMGRYSFLLVGTDVALSDTFGSTCHGAGRVMSRKGAKRSVKDEDIQARMRALGVYVRGQSRGTLAEEVPEAYKDVEEVVAACHGAGISKPVARMKPIGNIKG